jgi:hypothetical protein
LHKDLKKPVGLYSVRGFMVKGKGEACVSSDAKPVLR